MERRAITPPVASPVGRPLYLPPDKAVLSLDKIAKRECKSWWWSPSSSTVLLCSPFAPGTRSPWWASCSQAVPLPRHPLLWVKRPSRAACLCLLMRDKGTNCEMGGTAAVLGQQYFRVPLGGWPHPRQGKGSKSSLAPTLSLVSLQSIFLFLVMFCLPLIFPPTCPQC